MPSTALPMDLTASAIYAFNLLLLLSCVLDRRLHRADQRVSLILLRIIMIVPMLAAQYGFSRYAPDHRWVAPLFFSESILAIFLLILAFRLQALLKPEGVSERYYTWIIVAATGAMVALAIDWRLRPPAFYLENGVLYFPHYGQLYFLTLFALLTALVMAWRLEAFWRSLASRYRWQYKYLVLGFLLMFGCIVWSASYRLTYLDLPGPHRLLISLLLAVAWLLIVYATARHRLLNRQIFISRKVVFSAIVPSLFAVYLLGLGLTSLLIKSMGWTLPFVVQWLLVVLGLLLIAVVALFRRLRARVKYFISTHFYLNKYDYRDVWLDFSKLLQGAVSEEDVAAALRRILQEYLYTRTILIWLGDPQQGYRLVGTKNGHSDYGPRADFAPDDPLVVFLQSGRLLYMAAIHDEASVKSLAEQKQTFFQSHDVVLMAALIAGEQCVGLIGLGPEYTGGRYGRDDYDLLAALGSQAATALLATRNAEHLAHIREQSAWQILSAFVLHDIKNAATMLALVQQNAAQHLHDPEFQQDMLTAIDDALKRMNKVRTRLKTLKGEIAPVFSPVALGPFLGEAIGNLQKKLPRLSVALHFPEPLTIQTDPDFLAQILDNLMLNALEAGEDHRVELQVAVTKISPLDLEMTFIDNGPGIAPALLPHRLFEPFATTKAKGSGIGLWQVKCMVESLGGAITAGNSGAEGGACFRLRLPLTDIHASPIKTR